ncbi:MAG: tyrosine-type recombinase/integrase [Ruminococcus bicirculans (ex Wegman et al. 2014)]|uniref:site-specific integrase n=1 Tax=Ruminococcus bicirculans (ex Wegman et al. 2014) TaxID=1160721 RepID=UPI0039918034
MPVYKDKNGTWYAMVRYEDWQGERKQKCKRGFVTKREAQNWERRFLLQANSDLDMLFKDFYKLYEQDMRSRLKQNTWEHKAHVIQSKILPYFGDKPMKDIQARDVLSWQNELLRHRDKNGKPYSETYLKNLHNQLSCIFNHAVRYYDLGVNPAAKAGSIGVKNAKEMNFWTKDEYMQFSEVMMDKPVSFYAFEMLYWCGIRLGELLALTPEDFDFQNRKLRINKSYQRIKGQDVITEPKTKKSNRTIEMPDFLCEEMQDYLRMLYDQKSDERIFTISKSYLHHEMDRGKETGLKRIRIHDLRHSHVSLLIELGFSAVAIADRVGHESIEITYRYAHLFPSKQAEMANKLSELKKGDNANVSEKP